MFKSNKGIEDKVTNKRVGLIFASASEYSFSISNKSSSYNVILEVVEIYNDIELSKLKVTYVPYNKSDVSERKIFKNFNPWVKNTFVHWLKPSIPVDRDNKLNDILGESVP